MVRRARKPGDLNNTRFDGEGVKDVKDDRILRQAEVSRVTGLPRTSLDRRVRNGTFPAPLLIGPKSVGWLSSEVQEWIRGCERKAVPKRAGKG